MASNYYIIINKKENQRGIAVYCAVAVLSIVLAIALGVGLITAERIKMINQSGDSVRAFMIAQTGIEVALYAQIEDINSPGCFLSDTLEGATYALSCSVCGPANEFLCVKSTGTYRGANRAVRIKL